MKPLKITIECDEEGQMNVEERGTLWDVTVVYATCLRSILDRADKTAGNGAEVTLSELAYRILQGPPQKMEFATVKIEDFHRATGKGNE